VPPLPHVPEPTRAGLRAFELRRGQPAAIAALRDELGLLGLARLLPAFAWRQLTRDPLAGLPPLPDGDVEGWMTRRQLLPVLLLDEALRLDLGLPPARAMEVLRAVVGASGAAFLDDLFPRLDPAAWTAAPVAAREALVRRVFRRFGNIEAADVDVQPEGVGFDVRACRFAHLLRQLDRRELGPLFCHADAVFFASAGSGYEFSRSTTLAGGGDRCDFRLRFTGAREAG
jgi:hypothetical protein